MRNGARGLMLTGGIAGALAMAACGSSNSGSSAVSTSPSSASVVSSAAAAVSSAPAMASSAAPMASSPMSSAPMTSTAAGGGASIGKVGILLPDTQSSNRWVTSDPIALKADCAKYKLTCDIQNAQDSDSTMITQAQAMMNDGVKVLLVTPLDAASADKIETAAKAKGIITIDYDRLAAGGSASLYVSFDNVKVGELQGQALTQCSQVKGAKAVQYVDVNGAPTDNNATLFKQGYDSVLSKTAGWTKVDDQSIPLWTNQIAGTTFASMLQAHPAIKAVMVANDGMANAVITDLTKEKLNGKVAVSGQDTTVQGLQHILKGDQCYTIYKPSTDEADPAIAAAADFIQGKVPTTTQTIKDPSNGRVVPAMLATPIAVTKANINLPIAATYAPKAQVCAGAYAALCTAAGVK